MRIKSDSRSGYTLIELIVALLLFAIGGLALASTSAVMGRILNRDAVRERAGREAAREIEILAAGCRDASSGHQGIPQIDSEWSVSRAEPGRIDVTESVSYFSSQGRRTDSYRVLMACP
jgi:prepilin-type N-terminal cleavage/methylation domain-containing protein